MRRLLIRPGALGDCIVSLPALEALCGSEGEVWAPRENVPLIRFASHVRAIADTGVDLLGIPGIDPPTHLIEALTTFDQVVSWYGANREEFRDAVRRLRIPFHFFPALPDMWGAIHACDFFAGHAATLGAEAVRQPRLDCPRWQGGFCAIHPFSGGKRKNWPLERYQSLARQLPIPVHFTAGPEELLPQATRFTDRYEMAKWLAGASLFIGNDSGPMHVAAAVGTPVVALFGPTNPNVWSPRGAPSKVVVSRDSTMESITIESVLEAATALIAQ